MPLWQCVIKRILCGIIPSVSYHYRDRDIPSAYVFIYHLWRNWKTSRNVLGNKSDKNRPVVIHITLKTFWQFFNAQLYKFAEMSIFVTWKTIQYASVPLVTSNWNDKCHGTIDMRGLMRTKYHNIHGTRAKISLLPKANLLRASRCSLCFSISHQVALLRILRY